ncbi:MAG TPA: DUF3127 domain-containing protein [Chitinophagaceae bacterium]|nr:DUF3127 domain-containing protein [Chitinophagaceae bacterium]
MALEVIGTLHEIYEQQQITPTFAKREFVLEIIDEAPTGMTYTNYASFQLVNNSCSLIDHFQKGEKVKVHFNLRGNSWERDGVVRYITNLNAWRVERVGEPVVDANTDSYGGIPQAGPSASGPSTPQFNNQPPTNAGGNQTSGEDTSDDLPF